MNHITMLTLDFYITQLCKFTFKFTFCSL